MTKQQVLKKLTELYNICHDSSTNYDDGWMAIAGAISTVEDVAIKEIDWEQKTENQANNYFNCVDLIKTLSANNALGLQRVHGGTDNEDTVADLLYDIIGNLYARRGLDDADWEELREGLTDG